MTEEARKTWQRLLIATAGSVDERTMRSYATPRQRRKATVIPIDRGRRSEAVGHTPGHIDCPACDALRR